MAETEGKLLTCDLCGATVLLKYVDDGEMYGGYTKWREYEKMPDGWSDHLLLNSRLLCPSCAERIEAAINAVVDEIRGESKDG